MIESILQSVKEMIGVPGSVDSFDTELIIIINSIFSALEQIGVGPDNGFSIEDDTTLWNEYLDDSALLGFVKPYISLKTKLMFDPPTSTAIADAMNRQISEFEWRINVFVDLKNKDTEVITNDLYEI